MKFIRTLLIIVVLLLGWAVLRNETHLFATSLVFGTETIIG